MQKKLIALAIAGLASSAAFAQSNVTIYGSIDFGYLSQSGESGGANGNTYKGKAGTDQRARSSFTSGGSAGNRIGFKGTEDLGNGLKALFEVEFGFSGEQNDKPGFNSNRHAYVGLTGGFGTVVGGRLDGVRYGVYNTYDPFAGGSVGNFTQMTVQYDRADNAVAYISPRWNGLGLVLAYATNTNGPEGSRSYTNTCNNNGDNGGNGCDDQLGTVMVTYDNGPISLKADYESTRTRNSVGSSNGSDGREYVATFGGSYDFGVAKLSAVYDVIKGGRGSFIGASNTLSAANVLNDTSNGEYDRRNYFVGVSVPVGKFTVMGNIGRVNNKAQDNADAIKYALGAKYNLSKRTNLYTAYSRIKNDDNATFNIGQSAASNGAGVGVQGVELGLRHQF